MLPIHKNIQKKLDHFLETQKIPHLIFHGSSGTGKRTLVYNFLNKIYGNDKYKLKSNVMFVNCAHGKGIKFIRDELKFFAKTNIQGNQGVLFKSIVLFNADSLTIDAQSALRRCIELFSYNTRFFIVVENKHKMLNPILSRFCEIYVPEFIDDEEKLQNLHQFHLHKLYDMDSITKIKHSWFDQQIMSNSGTLVKELGRSPTLTFGSRLAPYETIKITHQHLVEWSTEAYEQGMSCLDLLDWVNISERWTPIEKTNAAICFQKIKSEFRCEKMLMFYLLDFLFLRSDMNLRNISLI